MIHRTPGRQARWGLIVTVLIVLTILGSLNLQKLPLLRNGNTLAAVFAEAGSLQAGDDVRVSGARVGKVSDVRLDGDVVVAELVLSDDDLQLGERTEARIVTLTLLGRAGVELVPRGEGRLEPGDRIPIERTSAPYNITSALNQLTDETAEIDKQGVADALEQVSTTFRDTPRHARRALTGIHGLATTIAENDAGLGRLLDRADRVTEVLAGRNRQISSLLTSGTSVLAQLNARQAVVVDLLESVRELSRQLRAVISENDKVVEPALTELNDLAQLLNAQRADLQDSITGLRNYAMAFGEALSTGPWFDAYIQNLTAPGTLAPIISGVAP
jgi:phospholipid/cholesterol/gamma-HCH transport system substrate-binding protein